MKLEEFILAHEGDDLGRLALARDRYAAEVEDFDLALTTLEVRRKLRFKVPQWYDVPSLRYPLRVSGEQCSSAETARYKAAVALTACEEGPKCVTCVSLRLADLTGGLGVDSWAFSQVFGQVLYNEMRPELASAAAHNFRELGVTNVTVQSREIAPGNVSEVLGGFQPDILFLDPARRALDGHKVFRLEDCQPDVLQLLPELLEACPRLLLKLSPMADISLVCKQLACVKEVHVVAAEGECKELLLLLEKGYDAPVSMAVYENGSLLQLGSFGPGVPIFGPGLKISGGPDPGIMAQSPVECIIDGLGPGPKMRPGPKQEGTWPEEDGAGQGILFEPGKGLMKAGAFELPCRYGLAKLGQHTHLYIGETIPEELKPFGKCFQILETVPLNNRSIKEMGKRYPQAEVTARNIPLTSDQLRTKLGVRSGGDLHIFGVKVDADKGNRLLVVRRME